MNPKAKGQSAKLTLPPTANKKRLTIIDVLLECRHFGLSHEQAVLYVRTRIPAARLSAKQLRSVYDLTAATKEAA